MVTSLNIIYSASAIYRMVGAVFPVVRFSIWWKVVLVVFRGRRPRFMSRRAFLVHFVEWRKLQAELLRVNKDVFAANQYEVRNPEKRSMYRVQLFPGGLRCECEDFSNQAKFFGRACCKHGYAVLFQLGYGSLSDYIEQRKE